MTGCVINGPVSSQTENATFEAWMAILAKLAEEKEQEPRAPREPGNGSAAREIKLPLEKLPEGPWRSLGGYFDYSLWPDRERFLELDRAIASGQDIREPEVEHQMEMI